MQIVLFEPEIPPNTGNIARLCAATDTTLNLIEPLGFKLEDRYLKRAGLDYWPNVRLRVWPDWAAFAAQGQQGARLVLTSAKKGQVSAPAHQFAFEPEDCLVFGPETRGLPQEILALSPHRIRIPCWKAVCAASISPPRRALCCIWPWPVPASWRIGREPGAAIPLFRVGMLVACPSGPDF